MTAQNLKLFRKKITFFKRCVSIILWSLNLSNHAFQSYYDLFHRITRKCCRNCETLNKNSYLHWQEIPTYLYSQLTKLLLISRNMNYPRKNLIYLKQVYTFQSNQIKFENPKSSLPLKRFTVHFLTTLNPRKPKVR